MAGARRFVVLAAAILGLYGVGAWLFILPPIRLPDGLAVDPLPASGCTGVDLASRIRDKRAILLVPLADVPSHLIDALRKQEDEFYHHQGVDWAQMARAMGRNLAAGEYRYGASTITMQLMRELFLHKQPTLLRKLREIAYALQAERRLSKERILELYLNVVHWGPGIRGVGVASCYYFGVPPAALDAEQTARLVAVLPSPDRLGPALYEWAGARRRDGAAAADR